MRHLALLIISSLLPLGLSAAEEKANPLVARFENDLAVSLIERALVDARDSNPGDRLAVIQNAVTQLEDGVAMALVKPETASRARLLAWLAENGLSGGPETAEDELLACVKNQLQDSEPAVAADLGDYLPNTFSGRQAYLDALAADMVDAEQLVALTTSYDGYGPLDFEGFEEPGQPVFRYRQGVLAINLEDMTALPAAEISAIAMYFGFPGQHLAGRLAVPPGFDELMQVDNFAAGWGLYILPHAGFPGEPARLADSRHALYQLELTRVMFALQARLGQQEETPGPASHAAPRYVVEDAAALVTAYRQALAFKQLRREVEASGLDVVEFHDRLLGLGRVPTGFAISEIRRWISDRGREDAPSALPPSPQSLPVPGVPCR